MSLSLFIQILSRVSRIWPCSPPAKKARIERLLGGWPRWGGPSSLYGILISGKETSLDGLKPSEVLALQRTLMKLLNSLGLEVDISGPWHNTLENKILLLFFKEPYKLGRN